MKQFEDLECWRKGRILVNDIYRVTSNSSLSKDYPLRDQMRRAAISIISNIAEGFERSGNNEFIHFLSIAKASAGELRAQLYIASDQKYISSMEFDLLKKNCMEVSRMIAGLMGYLRKMR